MQSTSASIPEFLLKRWTVADYRRMIASGVLTSDDRVELLDGQVIEMVPQDPPHASTTDEGSDYLKALFAGRAKVRAQLPVTLSDHSEPEPDIAVVRLDENRYRDRHPNPADIFLLIEIANATLTRDRSHKAKLYAQAEVPEYWVIDVNQRQAIIFRNPEGGIYQSEAVLTANDEITPIAVPELTVQLKNILL
jgi:Uma2 family endonuclease